MIIFVLVLLFVNCGRVEHAPVIVQGIFYSPETLDPAKINDSVTGQIIPHIVETLVRLDTNGTIVPGLADAWEVSPDNRTYSFHLRPNIQFHDGSILTASDVSISFLRQFQKSCLYYTAEPPNIFELLLGDLIKQVSVDDESNVTFTLNNPDVLFMYLLATPYISGIISEQSLYTKGQPYYPVSTGPFYYYQRNGNGNIELRTFDKYYEATSSIKNIVFKVKSESELERLALIDSIDVLTGIRGSALEQFRDGRQFIISVKKPLSTFFLSLNTKQKYLSENGNRHFVESLVDKKQILSIVSRSNTIIADGPLPPGLWEYQDDVQFGKEKIPNTYDTTYIDTLTVIGYTPSARTRFILNAIISDIKRAGLILNEDYDEVWQNYFEKQHSGKYDMSFNGWKSDIIGDPYFFLRDLFSSNPALNAGILYKNPAVDSLLAEARITSNREERRSIYQRILDLIENDCPAVFIHHVREVFITNNRFSPIVIDPYGYIHYEAITTY